MLPSRCWYPGVQITLSLWWRSLVAGWAGITNRVSRVSCRGTPGSTVLRKLIREFQPVRCNYLERDSRSALSVVAHCKTYCFINRTVMIRWGIARLGSLSKRRCIGDYKAQNHSEIVLGVGPHRRDYGYSNVSSFPFMVN